jgi:phosphocarrier protein HPr
MIEVKVEIVNERGMHARAASKFVHLASNFKSVIKIVKGTVEVDGKSILGLLLLQASKGTTITLKIDGEDEDKAQEALVELIEDKFGESK